MTDILFLCMDCGYYGIRLIPRQQTIPFICPVCFKYKGDLGLTITSEQIAHELRRMHIDKKGNWYKRKVNHANRINIKDYNKLVMVLNL